MKKESWYVPYYVITLLALFYVFVPLGYAQNDEPLSGQTQIYPSGSPEAVVNALIRFDFNHGDRADPERYREWVPLTTNGEPESENAGYWGCTVYFVISSYKVLGKESITPDRVRVLAEFEVSAITATAKTLAKQVNQCYWPEQSMSIYDSVNGGMISLTHPITASGFIDLISDKEIGADFLTNTDHADAENIVIPVAKNRRRWQLKVDVVHRKGKWRVLSDWLPREFISLRDAVAGTKARIKSIRNEIQICLGVLPPPNEYFKQYNCPSSAFPEKKLIHSLNELKTLEAIQGAN